MSNSSTKPMPVAQMPAPTNGDPFGAWGNLYRLIGQQKPDLSKLPPEIAAQLQDDVRVDEGGGQSHNYNFNENPFGGFKGPDGKYYVQVGDPSDWKGGDGGVKDPSKVTYQPGAGYVTTNDNIIDTGHSFNRGDYARLARNGALVVGGGMGLVAGLGAAAGGLAAEGGAGWSLGGAGSGAAAGSSLQPLTGVTLAPETTIGTVGSVGGGAAAGGGGVLSSLGGVQGAARLGLGLAALGGAAHNSSGAAAGTTDAGSIIEQMANANRVDQNTPLGSRHWAQDPATGRWTVNDTMNPAEQSNFENVQGLNASGTDFSKQFLAKLLAAPPTPTAGHSFTVNGRTIGG
jgi:hypothetical protein